MKKRYTFRNEIYLGLAIGLLPLAIAAVLYSAGFDYAAYGVAAVGILFLGYHHTIRVDYIINVATYQKTVYGIPLYTKIKMKADSICCVEQVLEVRVRSNESKTRENVYVTYLRGAKKLKIKEYGNLEVSRRFSERLCRRMGLPFHDLTEGPVRIREPSELDMPLGELLRKRGEKVEYPSIPMSEDIRIDRDFDSAVLQFAPQPYRWHVYAVVVMVFVIFVAVFWSLVINHEEVNSGVFWLMVTAASVFFVKAIISSHQPGYLYLDKSGITVRRMTWKKMMSFDEIEELACDGSEVTVIGDRARFMLPYDFYDDVLSDFVIKLIKYHAMQNTRAN